MFVTVNTQYTFFCMDKHNVYFNFICQSHTSITSAHVKQGAARREKQVLLMVRQRRRIHCPGLEFLNFDIDTVVNIQYSDRLTLPPHAGGHHGAGVLPQLGALRSPVSHWNSGIFGGQHTIQLFFFPFKPMKQ